MNIIAKFKFNGIKTWIDYYSNKKVATLELNIVQGTSEENKKFFEASPYGKIEIGTVNQAVIDAINLGEEYYVIIQKEKPVGF